MAIQVRWTLIAATLLAVIGGWLLSERAKLTLGFDPGAFGMAVLSIVGLLGIVVLVRGGLSTEARERVAPGELRAWIGVAFMLALLAYFGAHLHLFVGAATLQSAASQEVGRQIAILVIGWIVVSGLVRSWRRREIQEDERDREIEREAAGLGRNIVVAMVMVLAVLISFSPADRLGWATHVMIGALLVFILMVGALIEHVAGAVRYWRDRP